MKHLKQMTSAALLALLLVAPVLPGTIPRAVAQNIITIQNGEITIACEDDEKVIMIDADGLESLISETLSEAMDGVQDVLTELDEMQLEIRLGNDNQLSFETENQMWEVNLDQVFKGVFTALDTALDQVDTDDWGGHRHLNDEDFPEEELADELNRLKEELGRLRQELDHLKEL